VAGVYISYPFCRQKCTYCNFASGVLPAELEAAYLDALVGEIRAHQWEWSPDTLYLGGGTPSRLSSDALNRLLDALPVRDWTEATIEAAPGDITAELARAWRDAGINRVSLGVQSFVERELRRTGRMHTAVVVEREVDVLRQAGIGNINIDLIAGLAGQTRGSWNDSLQWIERLAPPHVSVYMFEVDEDSRLGLEILQGGERFGAAEVPNDELTAHLYEHAVEWLVAVGIPRYEISNFARSGWESRHNLKYWRLDPYAGFGADAHSFDGRVRRQNAETVQDYLDRRRRGLPPWIAADPARAEEEHFFVGLRLSVGIEPTGAERSRFAEPIARLVGEGLLEHHRGRLRLTSHGVLLSNEVFQEFIA
jgi:oxygen-independent coproporphyrinogen III oxidase